MEVNIRTDKGLKLRSLSGGVKWRSISGGEVKLQKEAELETVVREMIVSSIMEKKKLEAVTMIKKAL